MDIDWPTETNEGKWLLYLMEISSTGVEHINCSPEEKINPLNIVSEKHPVNAEFAWNLTVGKPDVVLTKWSRTVKCEATVTEYGNAIKSKKSTTLASFVIVAVFFTQTVVHTLSVMERKELMVIILR